MVIMNDKLSQEDIRKMIPIIQEINRSIDTLLGLALAWSDADFETASFKLEQCSAHLKQAKEAAAKCTDKAQKEHYLGELEEVEALLNSFEVFIQSRRNNLSPYSESTSPSSN